MQFGDFALDPRLLKAVEALGHTEPTPIQQAAIPPLLNGRDLLGTAQTGTGKTIAFALPLLQSLLSKPTKCRRTRALIVTPTRELAEQIHATVRQLTKFTKINSATVFGGVGMEPQRRALLKGTDVIVACPGRLLDHESRRNADLGGVEVLVIDEADRMFDMGFLPQVRDIVAVTPRERHTMLFSATFPSELDRFADRILRDPERVAVGPSLPPSTVGHTLFLVHQEQKTEFLLHLLEETETASVLIFTRTKHRADRVADQIIRSGHRATALHSNKSQSQRREAMDGFRTGQYKMLVATDIAARGLDVTTISHVINYDMPETPDDYIHRVGRTGRATRSGDAMTLATACDRDTVRNIERVLGQPLTTCKPEGFGYVDPAHSTAIPRRKRGRGMLLPPRSSGNGKRCLTGRR